jgi:hypothetical protein
MGPRNSICLRARGHLFRAREVISRNVEKEEL